MEEGRAGFGPADPGSCSSSATCWLCELELELELPTSPSPMSLSIQGA